MAIAGDVNGDGFDDLLLGAPLVDSDGTSNAGEVFLIFGRADVSDGFVDLDELSAADGFVFKGLEETGLLGPSVRYAGDVNNDGYADMLFSAPRADGVAGVDAGETFLVLGGTENLLALDEADGSQDGVINLSVLGEDFLF